MHAVFDCELFFTRIEDIYFSQKNKIEKIVLKAIFEHPCG